MQIKHLKFKYVLNFLFLNETHNLNKYNVFLYKEISVQTITLIA